MGGGDRPLKTVITVTLDNGVLSYAATCDPTGAIALLESVKHALVSQALGGVGRPPDPHAPADGGRRAPGLVVRRVEP